MKLKKVYSIEVPISKEEYEVEEAQVGSIREVVEQLAEKLELQTTLVETRELEKE